MTTDAPAEHRPIARDPRPHPRPEPRKPAKRRASKRVLRAFAWTAGVASFVSPWAILLGAPKPVAAAPPGAPPPKPRVIIRHRIVRKVVWTKAPAAPPPAVRYVYTTAPSSGVAAPAPVVRTSGSHPH